MPDTLNLYAHLFSSIFAKILTKYPSDAGSEENILIKVQVFGKGTCPITGVRQIVFPGTWVKCPANSNRLPGQLLNLGDSANLEPHFFVGDSPVVVYECR